jgi:hypothetical protein
MHVSVRTRADKNNSTASNWWKGDEWIINNELCELYKWLTD